MKFGQLMECDARKKISLKSHEENTAWKLVLDVFLFFKNALYVGNIIVSIYFGTLLYLIVVGG